MAQTLKFGNGTWATKKGSTLAYSDEGGNFKPLPFTYTGAGKGTRVNKEGLIEVVENDRPRIDYKDSEDGVFLLEKASTNLVTYSEDLSTWASINVDKTLTQVKNPSGNLGVYEIAANSTASTHYIESYPHSATSGVDYTFSFFAKINGSNFVQVALSTGFSALYQNFNLLDGTLGNGNLTSGYSSNIEPFGNGWYRVSVKGNTVSANARFLTIPILTDIASRNPSFVGNGNLGIYVWGFQKEQSSQSSSYIPTQGTIQTRVQETAIGSGNSEVFNSEQGILYAEGSLINDDGTPNNITLGDNTFSDNRMMLLFSNGISNRISARFDSSGSDVTLNADGYDLTLNHKVVLKYKANDIAIWVDGFEIESGDFSFSAPSLLNRIDFYNPFGGGQNNFYGKTKEIGYYDEILTDLELETLTSYRTWEEMVKELNLNIIHNE